MFIVLSYSSKIVHIIPHVLRPCEAPELWKSQSRMTPAVLQRSQIANRRILSYWRGYKLRAARKQCLPRITRIEKNRHRDAETPRD